MLFCPVFKKSKFDFLSCNNAIYHGLHDLGHVHGRGGGRDLFGFVECPSLILYFQTYNRQKLQLSLAVLSRKNTAASTSEGKQWEKFGGGFKLFSGFGNF